MTGYGQGVAEVPGLKITVELRSVNSRYVDVKVRLPETLNAVEQELRRKVLATVKRGRVELDLRLERAGGREVPLALNRPVVESALAAWATLRDEYGLSGAWEIGDLMRVPGLFETSSGPAALDASALSAIGAALDLALAALDAERRREGGVLRDDLVERVARLSAAVAAIRALAAEVPAAVQRKIAERVQQLLAQVAPDPARLAQEAAFLADRADITEELVRLEGHLEHARSLLAATDGEPVGKRLEFL